MKQEMRETFWLVVAIFLFWYLIFIATTHLDNVNITEDMAGWNCETMGNRICGSDLRITHDSRIVVFPEFFEFRIVGE